jgi:hypothetical protein
MQSVWETKAQGQKIKISEEEGHLLRSPEQASDGTATLVVRLVATTTLPVEDLVGYLGESG